ncbi:MAG TPA: hypothetical protein VJ843_04030 [Candidatus Saccharimonadales bacterium]|nr:hypothetical protein [Candidatus Saccharimonadales bacterium]
MPREPRRISFPDDFVKHFAELFPQAEEAYSRIHRRLDKGLIDEVASFLLSQIKKFSPAEILNQLDENSVLNPEFVKELERRRDIAELYDKITRLARSSLT